MKKIIGLLCLAMALSALPVLAQSNTSAANSSSNTAIFSCMGTAVNAREAKLVAGITTHGGAITAAYTARAEALKAAYAKASNATIRAEVKAAWTTFKASVKSANVAWRKTRGEAWEAFKKASRACGAPASLTDTTNVNSEVRGE